MAKVTANTLDASPFEAYAVTCGTTLTFGGLRITTDAQMVPGDGVPIPGLYAAGSSSAASSTSPPGGTGLTNGAVFGRIAGARAGSATRK